MEQIKILHVFGIEHGPGNTTLIKSFIGFNKHVLECQAKEFIKKVEDYNVAKPKQFIDDNPLSEFYLYTEEYLDWENKHPVGSYYCYCDSYQILDNFKFVYNHDDNYNGRLLEENRVLVDRFNNINKMFSDENNKTADLVSFIHSKGFKLTDVNDFIKKRMERYNLITRDQC